MARIPDVTSLGGRPSPSLRPMVNVPGDQGRSGVNAAANIFARSAQDTGAGLEDAGKRLGALADDIRQGEIRIQNRLDTVARAKAKSAYTMKVNEQFTKAQTEGDLSDPKQFRDFVAFANEERDKIINGHEGSPDSRARLAASLEAENSGVISRATVAHVEAGRKAVDAVLGTEIKGIAAQAEQTGDIAKGFQQVDNAVADAAGTMLPQDEELRKQAGRGLVAKAIINKHLALGETDSAVKALNNPEVIAALTADERRQYTGKVIAAQTAQDKAIREAQTKLAAAAYIKGGPLDAQERLHLAGLDKKEGKQTPAQMIADYEGLMSRKLGRPYQATPEEVQRAYKLAGPEGGDFGTTLTGRALDIMNNGSEDFRHGLTTPEEDRKFLTAVTQYLQPIQYQNPDTGVMETRRPELPPHVKTALQMRGYQVPETPKPPQPNEQVGQAPEMPERGKTVWGLAGLVTGPIPTAAEALGRTPGVGQFFQPHEITQARAFIPQLQRDLVRVLQNNPKYAEGERKAIETSINIEPSAFDDPNAFRDRLIGIDDALEKRLQFAVKTASSSTVGRDERMQAMNIVNALVNFRNNLGVPPRFKSPEEVKKAVEAGQMKAGDEFIDDKGVTRMVPK